MPVGGRRVEWKLLILALLFLLNAVATFGIHVASRGVTTSTELFEGIPGYIIAIQVILLPYFSRILFGVNQMHSHFFQTKINLPIRF